MIDAHYTKIMDLSTVTYKAASLRTFYDTAEKYLPCLRSLLKR